MFFLTPIADHVVGYWKERFDVNNSIHNSQHQTTKYWQYTASVRVQPEVLRATEITVVLRMLGIRLLL